MKKIVIVEDDVAILEVVCEVLQSEGYEAIGCNKGENAMQVVQNEKPHLILMDVQLSGVDGRDICRQIRNEPDVAAVPIIMLSASAVSPEECKACGANDFMAKPFDIYKLINAVREYAM